MTTEPAKVTPMPHPNRALPPAAAAKTAAPAAPPKAVIQPIAPPKIVAAPAAPVKTVAPAAATVARPAPVVQARPPERVMPPQHQHQHRVEPRRFAMAPQTTTINHNYNYGQTPRHYPQHSHPQQSFLQHRTPSGGGMLMALFAGGMLGLAARGLMNNGSRPQSYPADYRGPTTGTHQLGLGRPMHPAVFESMMNAAIEGLPESRVRLNNGQEVPTTPEERMMFKQLTFNMLQRPDQPLDERLARTLLTPEAYANRNVPGTREAGTHISHFGDDFGSRRLGELVERNYNQLRDRYASEYDMYRSQTAQQSAPRYQQTAHNYPVMPRTSSVIRLF